MKILILLSLLTSQICFGAVVTKEVEYKDGDKTFEGLLVRPDKVKGDLPVIVMIHNWKGVSDETKTQATRFAELGYLVFAADIYGKGVRPQDSKDAGQAAGIYKNNRALYRQRLNLGLQTALAQPYADATRAAVVGYCFGGTGAIELARSGAPLKAVVSFHGGLDSPTPADGANIKAPVLALQGADDPYVPAKDIAAFEAEMKSNHVQYRLIRYPHAVHSFTEKGAGNDNSKGAAYNESADKRSFAEAKKFLAENLKK